MPYISIDFANPTRMEAHCGGCSEWLNIHDDAGNRIALHVPFELAIAIADVFRAHKALEAAARHAAAPELLEALEATLDELLCVRDYIDDASRGQLLYRGGADLSEMAGNDLARIDEKIAIARAAIAKVKGEAQ